MCGGVVRGLQRELAIGLFVAVNPNVLEVNNQSAETIYWLKSARNQETVC